MIELTPLVTCDTTPAVKRVLKAVETKLVEDSIFFIALSVS